MNNDLFEFITHNTKDYKEVAVNYSDLTEVQKKLVDSGLAQLKDFVKYEKNILSDKKYYAINSRGMAEAIRFISGQNYYVNDHKYITDRKVYTFEDTELFREVLTHVTTYSKHFQNKNY